MTSDVPQNLPSHRQLYESAQTQATAISAAEDSALQKNLSTLTLEKQTTIQHSVNDAQVMLDKNFIAELEKDMYSNKGHNDFERNSAQMYANKEAVYANKQNLTPLKNAAAASHSNNSSPSSNSGASPKMHNAERQGQYASTLYAASQETQKPNNLENAAAASVMANSNVSNTQSVVNRIWYERVANQSEYYAQPSAENIYSNQGIYQATPAAATSAATEANHSFVAISNRVVPPKTANQVYASAASIYGSVTGPGIYDTVASTPSTYYGQVPLSHISNHTNGQIYSNGSGGVTTQSAIYDEVALDDYLRPHRPAPLAPPQLSAQQIQRRLEKLKRQQESQMEGSHNLYAPVPSEFEREQQKLQQMMQDLGPNAQELDVRNALRAASGDTTQAIRHYKIDQLSR